jgi:hypothetical protein
VSYGQGPYGQTPWGGWSFDQTGPSLVSSNPASNATGVALNAAVSFVLTSPSDLDPFTLNTSFNGVQVVVAGVLLAGYTGTIVNDGTNCTITILTHPAFTDGSPVTVTISITDLAGIVGNFSFTFNTDSAVASVSESHSVSDSGNEVYGAKVSASESLNLSDSVSLSGGNNSLIGVSEAHSVSDSLVTRQTTAVSDAETLVLVQVTTSVYRAKVTSPATLVLTEGFRGFYAFHSSLPETLALSEIFVLVDGNRVTSLTTLTLTEASHAHYAVVIPYNPTLTLREELAENQAFLVENLSDTSILISFFGIELRLNEVEDLSHYYSVPLNDGTPLEFERAVPQQDVLQSGVTGTVPSLHNTFSTFSFTPADGNFNNGDVGSYIQITGPATSWNVGYVGRILQVIGPTSLLLDRSLLAKDPQLGHIQWSQLSGVRRIVLTTNKLTHGESYLVGIRNLRLRNSNAYYNASDVLLADVNKPTVVGTSFMDDGTVIITFDNKMRPDAALSSPSEYVITGPSTVIVQEVRLVDPYTVALKTIGIGPGSYTLTVNAAGTPKDLAGNPTDPLFNQAIFQGNSALNSRSIFTDKGPIAKPPLILQSGVGATIQTYTTTMFGPSNPFTSDEVVFPGAAFTSAHVGLTIQLSGSALNQGSYKIVSLVGNTGNRLKLQGSLRLPDAANGNLGWALVDPREGEIADDPSDVAVRINGVPQVVQAVVGLLGQVILAAPPTHGANVQVDYSWICDPTVDIRRLNSKEFTLNAWGSDPDLTPNTTQHKYRYKNSLVTPSLFVPDDIQSVLDQPLSRNVHYRAFERAYSALLNQPDRLLLNTPNHRIAYVPLEREVTSVAVVYDATHLPEADPVPWVREGVGLVTLTGSRLQIQDASIGPFPTGNPIFWVRPIDLTFPHILAASWRVVVGPITTTEGVYTGVSVGWSDGERALVVGYLTGGQIGFLKRGAGNDPSQASAWTGGILQNGGSSNQPAPLDSSFERSYRLFQGNDGVIRLYVDGNVVETLRVTEGELPFLEELNNPFNSIEGFFFGSLSRRAQVVSTWAFVRYFIVPTDLDQTARSVFVSYEGDQNPEISTNPWVPVGYHGNESIQSSRLLLDSTSATTDATEAFVGLVDGDFRGFTRIEPLLAASSDVVLDVGVQLLTFTHGIDPNAIMAAIDDGDRLIQLSFITTQAQPKVSYPGRTLPENATPIAWTPLGGSQVDLIGQTLRITDTSNVDGKVYAVEDLAPDGPSRIISTLNDWYAEARLTVNSRTPDNVTGFAGVTFDVFDGTRAIGLMLREVLGVRYVAFHSDGNLLAPVSQWAFEWADGSAHTYRIVKSTNGNLVSVFVDNTLLGTYPYSSFSAGVGNPTSSFGSSTASSTASQSVVDWMYFNVWRAQPGNPPPRYVGFWKGFDPASLTGYHLPLKSSGNASVNGNVLTDPSADFLTAGVAHNDCVVADSGSNKGTYTVAAVLNSTTLTINETFPVGPTVVGYRIPKPTDWTVAHRYRIVRDPGGSLSLFLDIGQTPILRVDYDASQLPSRVVGVPYVLSGGLPSITWGAFDPTNISQSAWDFVRYGITRASSVTRIVPSHEVLNDRNVISSPEHLSTNIPHNHTQFSASSTGVPYPWEDLVNNPALGATTQLNEGTPIVPATQTYEVRKPTPTAVFLSSLNNPEDVLNQNGGFLLNDSTTRVRIIVPKDVLYSDLEVVEQTVGDPNLLAPFTDTCEPHSLQIEYQKEVCLDYEANTLPELDPTAATPWVLASDDQSQVSTTVFGGVLTYSIGNTGTASLYRNATPLTDPVGLDTTVDFRLKLVNDGTGGTGDSGVRFGFSAIGLTAALAFVTTPFGDREVQLVDLNSNTVLGAIPFDYLDGSFHVYRLVKNVVEWVIDFYIDP